MFYMLLTAVFLSSILGFWLGAMDEAAIVARTRSFGAGARRAAKGGAYYVPKVVLTTVLGFTGLASYLYVRLHESGDPAFDTYEEDFTTCVRARARALSFFLRRRGRARGRM